MKQEGLNHRVAVGTGDRVAERRRIAERELRAGHQLDRELVVVPALQFRYGPGVHRLKLRDLADGGDGAGRAGRDGAELRIQIWRGLARRGRVENVVDVER